MSNDIKTKRTIGDNQNPIEELSHKAYHSLKDLIVDTIHFNLTLIAEDLREAEKGKRLFDRNKAIISAQDAVRNLRVELAPIKESFNRHQTIEQLQKNIDAISSISPAIANYEAKLKERSEDESK